MKLIVEFYKDFDPSVLNGMGYAYAFRTLYMQGSKEHLDTPKATRRGGFLVL